MRARKRSTLSVLLRGDAGVCTRGVYERHDGKAVSLGERHHAHRLAIPLGMSRAEVAVDAVLDVAALLVADQGDRPSVEATEARDDCMVVRTHAIPVQLDPVVEQPLDIVER